MLIISVLIKPGWPKRFYKRLISDYEARDLELAREIDSLKQVNSLERERLNDSIYLLNENLIDITYDLQQAKKENQRASRRLRDYRFKSYDERFKLFTKLISETDSISGP